MRIAEAAQVQRAYPGVSADAVEHLLWCLHRVRPDIEAGETGLALQRLRCDLVQYGHDLTPFDTMGVPRLFNALTAGRIAFADELGALRLLHREQP